MMMLKVQAARALTRVFIVSGVMKMMMMKVALALNDAAVQADL